MKVSLLNFGHSWLDKIESQLGLKLGKVRMCALVCLVCVEKVDPFDVVGPIAVAGNALILTGRAKDRYLDLECIIT